MALKETIAFVGTFSAPAKVLARHLAQGGYRLLFVSSDEDQDKNQTLKFTQQLRPYSPHAEIETIDCVKNGCWEADIIILIGKRRLEGDLIEKIKDVATQKIVIEISQQANKSLFIDELQKLKQVLPNSKVVGLFYNIPVEEMFILGEDKESINSISVCLERIGYKKVRHATETGIIYSYSSLI